MFKPQIGLKDDVLNKVQWSQSPTQRELHITQGYGTTLSLEIHEFDPLSDEEPTIPSAHRQLYSRRTPYGLKDLGQAYVAIEAFVARSVKAYIEHKIRDSDGMTKSIFRLALQFSNGKNVS